MERYLNPTDYGWKASNQVLLPLETASHVSPDKILNRISCKCWKGCGQTCACRKLGIPCSAMFSVCGGVDCMNREVMRTNEDIENISSVFMIILAKSIDIYSM